MRILITGTVVGNGGDAAITHATIATLTAEARSDKMQFEIRDSVPAIARRKFPRAAVGSVVGMHLYAPHARRRTRARLRARRAAVLGIATARGRGLKVPWRILGALGASLRSYEQADLVVYTGGTTLVEIYPLDGKLFELRLAAALRRPLVLFTQSLGPFTTTANQRAVRRAVGAAELVLVREARSGRHLHEIGCRPGAVVERPDVVFAVADLEALQLAAAARGPVVLRRVAISVRDWKRFEDKSAQQGRQDYLEAVRHLARALRERGIEVSFLSTCQGDPDYWTDDSVVAREVVAGLPPDDGLIVDARLLDPLELREAYRDVDLVVATRMHAAILALGAGVPVLPIAYEFKTTELFTALGLGDHIQDIARVDGDGLVRALDALVAALPARRAALFSGVASMAEQAGTAAELAVAVITHGATSGT